MDNVFRNVFFGLVIYFCLSPRAEANDPSTNPYIKMITRITKLHDLFVADNPENGFIALVSMTEQVNGSSFRYEGNITKEHLKLVWVPPRQEGTRLNLIEVPVNLDEIVKRGSGVGLIDSQNFRNDQVWSLDSITGQFSYEAVMVEGHLVNRITLSTRSGHGKPPRSVSFTRPNVTEKTKVAPLNNWEQILLEMRKGFGNLSDSKFAFLRIPYLDMVPESPTKRYLDSLNALGTSVSVVALDLGQDPSQRPKFLSEFSSLLLTIPTPANPDFIDLDHVVVVGIRPDGTPERSTWVVHQSNWSIFSSQTIEHLSVGFALGGGNNFRIPAEPILNALKVTNVGKKRFGKNLIIPLLDKSFKDSIPMDVGGDPQEYRLKIVGDAGNEFNRILSAGVKESSSGETHPLISLIRDSVKKRLGIQSQCLHLF